MADGLIKNICNDNDLHWVDSRFWLKEPDSLIRGVLNMMKEDGLILEDQNRDFWIKATTKCLTFNLNGGYKQKLINDSIKAISIEKSASNATRNEKWLRYGAVGAAVGSLALVCIEILKLCQKCK